MIIKYEKEVEGEEGLEIVDCEEAEANFIHYCYNDESPSSPCKRVRIK